MSNVEEEDDAVRMDRCTVCGQTGSRFHYGIVACDGCKAFFRRSIRLKLHYICRRKNKCTIDATKRNVCRACRFAQCLKAGMNANAIQLSPPDRKSCVNVSSAEISSASSSAITVAGNSTKPTDTCANLLYRLMNDSEFLGRMSPTELTQFVNRNFSVFLHVVLQVTECGKNLRMERNQNINCHNNRQLGWKTGSLEECIRCFKDELTARVEFQKKLRSLDPFPVDDQVALYRSHVIDSMILSTVKRSLPLHQLILLDEEIVIAPDSIREEATVAGLHQLVCSISEDLIEPFRELEIDSIELCCLKIISFLNPEVCSAEIKDLMKKKRLAFQLILENYVNAKPLKSVGRFGCLLMYLRTLQSVGQRIKERYRFARQMQLLPADALLDDACREPREPWDVLGELLTAPPIESTCGAENSDIISGKPASAEQLDAHSGNSNEVLDYAELQPSVHDLRPQEDFAEWAFWYLM